ncbi:hypothetical protein V2G26_005094 [Clonostachys chloroleuca]
MSDTSNLTIERIDVFQVDLPYSGGMYQLSGGRTYTTIVRITTNTGLQGWGESTPFGSTWVAAHARGARVEHRASGYIGHSIKLSGDDPTTDAARIAESLADRQAGENFIVDANGGLTVEFAMRMLRLLPRGPDFVLEAPCQTWRECVSLRRRTDIPIIFDELAMDEISVTQLIADDAGEGIGMKISKTGGLTRCRRQRDLCLAAGLTLSVQEPTGSDIPFAAIIHMAQMVPERSLRCYWGKVKAPKAPGLGITPDLKVLGEPVATYT